MPENLMRISSHAFSGTMNLISLVLPSSVAEIGSSAFKSSSLETIVIPENISVIGNNAFYGCRNLTEMNCTGPSSHTSGKIGIGAFEGCSRLETLRFPDSISELEGWTVIGCESLKEISVGKNVRKIGDYGLVTNHPVKKIIFTSAIPPELGSNVFILGEELTSIIVPSESADIYVNQWPAYSKHMAPLI